MSARIGARSPGAQCRAPKSLLTSPSICENAKISITHHSRRRPADHEFLNRREPNPTSENMMTTMEQLIASDDGNSKRNTRAQNHRVTLDRDRWYKTTTDAIHTLRILSTLRYKSVTRRLGNVIDDQRTRPDFAVSSRPRARAAASAPAQQARPTPTSRRPSESPAVEQTAFVHRLQGDGLRTSAKRDG